MGRVPPYLIWRRNRIIPDWSKQEHYEYRPIPLGSAHRSPNIWLNAWVDPKFKRRTDSTGARLYDRLMESLLNVGLISGVGFVKSRYKHAQFRFHLAGRRTIYSYSRSWGNYVEGYGSTLFAVWPRSRQPRMRAGLHRVDVYSGWESKYGDYKHGPVQAIRVPWHGVITLGLGWFPEQSQNSPIYAMRNPHMSGQISYPFAYRRTRGCAGFDKYEIAKWIHVARRGRRHPGQRHHGSAWIRRLK